MPDDKKPLTPREQQDLDERDEQVLEEGLWGWYPFLYRDSGTLASGADPGITPWQPPNWTINFPDPNLTLPETPKLQTGGGAPAGNNYPTWPELVRNIVDNLPGGGDASITIPPCVMDALGGPVGTEEGLLDPTRLTERLGREAAPGTLDINFPDGSCASLSGLTVKWMCYPESSGWGPICRDGMDVLLNYSSGGSASLISPRPMPYKGGTNPSGWAGLTADEIVNLAWNNYLASIRNDCGCE